MCRPNACTTESHQTKVYRDVQSKMYRLGAGGQEPVLFGYTEISLRYFVALL